MKSSFLLMLCLAGSCFTSTVFAQSWSLGGNAISYGQFIGTTNNLPFSLRANNVERITIAPTGKVGINNTNPLGALDIVGTVVIRPGGTLFGAAPGLVLRSQPDAITHGGYIAFINDKSKKSYDIIQGLNCGLPGDNLNIVYYPDREINCGNPKFPFTVQEDKIGISALSPTANLHVSGTVRFQNLPYGSGSLLAIDPDGNIYRSYYNGRSAGEKDPEVDSLKQELNSLKELIKELQTKVNSVAFSANAPSLLQNYPNPYVSSTTIGYFLPKSVKKAKLLIFDETGREISTASLAGRGKQQLVLQNGRLQPGTYFYTLIADGKKIDTRKMLVSR